MPNSLPTPTIARALPLAGGPVTPPPFRLPAMYFAAALLWLLTGSALLLWLAPALAAGAVFAPAVFALVHALMLGVVVTAIMGTLQQFVPGALGVPLRSVRLGYAGFALLQTGLVVLLVGFFAWRGALQGLGWLLVLSAIGAVSRNVLRARRLSVHGHTVGLFISVAHVALTAGMVVAAARIGETLGWWHVERLSLLATHLLLGIAGFGTLSAIGVGSRMLPTFLGGPGDDQRWLTIHLHAMTIGLALFTGGALTGHRPTRLIGALGIAVSAASAVALGARWHRRRLRPLDGALWHVASAFAALALAIPMGMSLLLSPRLAFARWAAFVGCLLLGWLTTLVIGVAAKILPHMSFMRLAPIMPGFRARGHPNRLLHESWQHAAVLLLTVGWSGLTLALWVEHGAGARVAATLWSSGALLTAANYGQMYVRGRWPAPTVSPPTPMVRSP